MSPPTHYPPGTVRDLLATDHVSNKTRDVLTERLTCEHGPLRFFTPGEATTLRHITAHLIPQTEPDGYVVDLVGPIDKRLADGETDGWRYDTLPADPEAYRQALRGFQESAEVLYGSRFEALSTTQQNELIGQVQRGVAPGAVWQKLPPSSFFEELLAELVGIYYSHPRSQETIGYVGMADKPNWQRIGLNALEAREPSES